MDNIFLVILILISFLPCIWLFLVAFRYSLKPPSGIITATVIVLTVIIVGLSMAFLPAIITSPYFRIMYSILVRLGLIWLCSFYIRCSFFKMLFTVLIISSYYDNTLLISESIRIIILPYLNHVSYYGIKLLSFVSSMCITFPLTCYFMSRMLRPMIENQKYTAVWKYIWAIPASFYIIYSLSINPYYISMQPVSNGSRLLSLTWSFTTYLTYYIIVRMLTEVYKNAELNEMLHISEIRVTSQESQMESLMSYISDTRRARHDLRHNLLSLKGYVDRRDYDGIQNYIDRYLNILGSTDSFTATENPALDSIIAHYSHLAREIGAEVTLSVDFPKKLPVLENDLCIVLSNLMENAVEACSRQPSGQKKFISLKACSKDGMAIALSIKNSCDNKTVKTKNNIYMSFKHSGEGLGITSIRCIAEKYGGVVRFECKGDVFSANIYLPGAKTPL